MKFDEFNILLFDGMLPSISFVITDSVSYGGLFVCKKVEMPQVIGVFAICRFVSASVLICRKRIWKILSFMR